MQMSLEKVARSAQNELCNERAVQERLRRAVATFGIKFERRTGSAVLDVFYATYKHLSDGSLTGVFSYCALFGRCQRHRSPIYAHFFPLPY